MLIKLGIFFLYAESCGLMQITSGEVVSSYKTGNYHLNEKEPGRYFQGVGKSKIKKMQIGAQSCICSGPGQGAGEWERAALCLMSQISFQNLQP